MDDSLRQNIAQGAAGDLTQAELHELEIRLARVPGGLDQWKKLQILGDQLRQEAQRPLPSLPEDLAHRIMSRIAALPQSKAFGKLGRNLARPLELELTTASAGMFFLFAGLALLLKLLLSPAVSPFLDLPFILSFVSGLCASLLLLRGGLQRLLNSSSRRLPPVCSYAAIPLFGLTVVLGLGLEGPQIMSGATVWFGASGLLASGILALAGQASFSRLIAPMHRFPLRQDAPRASGFTILEIITVLFIMGILALVAVASVGNDPSKVAARTESLKAHLRYVQTKAMNTGPLFEDQHVWGMNLNADNTSYYLFHCTDTAGCTPSASQIHPPGEEGNLVQMSQDGVSVTGNQIVAFDRFGIPFSDATLTTPLSGALTLTLNDNTGNSRSITITPVTGLIE